MKILFFCSAVFTNFVDFSQRKGDALFSESYRPNTFLSHHNYDTFFLIKIIIFLSVNLTKVVMEVAVKTKRNLERSHSHRNRFDEK